MNTRQPERRRLVNGIPEKTALESGLLDRVTKLEALLDEARGRLKHTRCLYENAALCPACSLEARIDEAIGPQ